MASDLYWRVVENGEYFNTAEQGNASTLWKVDQVGTPLNSDMITIPIIASYYVYDRDNIKPGDLKATALIYVKYD